MFQLVDYRDLKAALGSNNKIARVLEIDKSQVSRWNGEIPDRHQGRVIRALIENPVMGMNVQRNRVNRELSTEEGES